MGGGFVGMLVHQEPPIYTGVCGLFEVCTVAATGLEKEFLFRPYRDHIDDDARIETQAHCIVRAK